MGYQKLNRYRNQRVIKELLEELPVYMEDFALHYQSRENSSGTIMNYLTDIRLFFKYLVAVDDALSSIKQVTLEYLDKLTLTDLQKFIVTIDSYQYDDGNFVFDRDLNDDSKIRSNDADAKSRKVAAIRSLYKFFHSTNQIQNNPSLSLSSIHKNKKEIVRMEKNESNKMLRMMENQETFGEYQQKYTEKTYYRDLAIVTLLLGTGIRVSEMVAIDTDSINWEKKCIKVTRKGGKDSDVYFDDVTKERLLDYLELERPEPKEMDLHAFFLSQQKTRISVRSVERIVKKYAQPAAPDKKITPHRLRASYGTNLYEATSDPMLVADALGHSGLGVVQRYVDSARKNRERAAIAVNWTVADNDE